MIMYQDSSEAPPDLFKKDLVSLEAMSCREVVASYGNATRDQVQYLMHCTPTELQGLLQEIRLIKCTFEHDRGDTYNPILCKDRGINAACGHQDENVSFISGDNNNAIAKITRAIAFVEAMGVNCDTERSLLCNRSYDLHIADTGARLLALPILEERQSKHGGKVLEARDGVQKKLENILKQLYSGKIQKTDNGLPELTLAKRAPRGRRR